MQNGALSNAQVKYVRDVPESAAKPPPVQQACCFEDSKLGFFGTQGVFMHNGAEANGPEEVLESSGQWATEVLLVRA